jgi:hypothetical protein
MQIEALGAAAEPNLLDRYLDVAAQEGNRAFRSLELNTERQVSGMHHTRRIQLLFPLSGQVVAVDVPDDVFERVLRVNLLLSSYLLGNRACVPSEHLSGRQIN